MADRGADETVNSLMANLMFPYEDFAALFEARIAVGMVGGLIAYIRDLTSIKEEYGSTLANRLDLALDAREDAVSELAFDLRPFQIDEPDDTRPTDQMPSAEKCPEIPPLEIGVHEPALAPDDTVPAMEDF
jgi:hypothetical protein